MRKTKQLRNGVNKVNGGDIICSFSNNGWQQAKNMTLQISCMTRYLGKNNKIAIIHFDNWSLFSKENFKISCLRGMY